MQFSFSLHLSMICWVLAIFSIFFIKISSIFSPRLHWQRMKLASFKTSPFTIWMLSYRNFFKLYSTTLLFYSHYFPIFYFISSSGSILISTSGGDSFRYSSFPISFYVLFELFFLNLSLFWIFFVRSVWEVVGFIYVLVGMFKLSLLSRSPLWFRREGYFFSFYLSIQFLFQ